MFRTFERSDCLMLGEARLSALLACGLTVLVLLLSITLLFRFGFGITNVADIALSGTQQTARAGSLPDADLQFRGSQETDSPSEDRIYGNVGNSFFKNIPVEKPVLRTSQTQESQKARGRFRLVRAETGQVITYGAPPDVLSPVNRNEHLPHEAYLETYLPVADRRQERVCLAKALYFEAGRDTRRAQVALAHLILNRVRSPGFPSTICGVVFQDEHRKNLCPFPFVCTGEPLDIKDKSAYQTAVDVAGQVMDRSRARSEIGGALRFRRAIPGKPNLRKAIHGKANAGPFENAMRIGKIEFY